MFCCSQLNHEPSAPLRCCYRVSWLGSRRLELTETFASTTSIDMQEGVKTNTCNSMFKIFQFHISTQWSVSASSLWIFLNISFPKVAGWMMISFITMSRKHMRTHRTMNMYEYFNLLSLISICNLQDQLETHLMCIGTGDAMSSSAPPEVVAAMLRRGNEPQDTN